ncbi:hypothetical protein VNO77_20944 [Canavalia gladiata]|uniref:Uncharacterized protein n=1 Tax=Canavalia gladiata TaxID=3824 RepID=A0AAN9LQ63_CANGL
MILSVVWHLGQKSTLFVEEGKSSVIERVLFGGLMTNAVRSYHTHMGLQLQVCGCPTSGIGQWQASSQWGFSCAI